MRTLAGLAEARQAAVSEETLKLYAAHLADFNPEDVREVIRVIGCRKRSEGETAFPSLGDLIEPLKRKRSDRMERDRQERKRKEEIDFFWTQILPDRMERYGWTEEQALERFPAFKGTKER